MMRTGSGQRPALPGHSAPRGTTASSTKAWILVAIVCGGLVPRGGQAQALADLPLSALLDERVFTVNALGLHTHLEGEWMIGYRYHRMGMEGNREGTSSVSVEEVLADFMVSPISMQMEMHMAEVMYAPSNSVTLMAMLPYHRRSMDHRTRPGGTFRTESEGLGDLMLGARFTVLGDATATRSRVLVSARLSLPTGSIGVRGDTPAGADQVLPYPMQFAGGSPRGLSSIAYLWESAAFAWMAELGVEGALGTNDRGYSTSDEYHVAGWAAWALADWVALTGDVRAASWSDFDGFDAALNSQMVPTADPELRGGRRIDVGPGVTLRAPHGRLSGARLALQLTAPLYQSLHGPQLEASYRVTGGLSWTF